ncbi:MAG TPA: hypothetical protein DCS28_01980 [Candidatus Moranbacteria bacterium]|nr:hypothetical protein [Candidatus Moranbacteria bacterium]HAT74786.1 hypothetical protein [Candidatus Moranbacteria bacterium]
MQIELNNKIITAILAVIIIGGAVFFGVKAINENISHEGSETKKDLTDKADKKNIAGLAANLDVKMTQLSAKMDEMNKQMATAQTAPISTAAPTATVAATTTTTDSVSAEEEILTELGNDIEDMKDIQEDAANTLGDINDNIEDLTGAVEDVAVNTGSMASDMNTLIAMAAQIQAKAQTMAQQADQAIHQYGEKVAANENVLTARQELLSATKSGDDRTITSAESKLISTLNASGSNLSPAFAQQYFKQVPASFEKISGMDSALDNLKVGGIKLDFSKMTFSKPSIDRSTNSSRSLDTTLRR